MAETTDHAARLRAIAARTVFVPTSAGEQIREAADEIDRLTARVAEMESVGGQEGVGGGWHPIGSTAELDAKILKEATGPPRPDSLRESKAFVCPHCGFEQVRVWPKPADNHCGECHEAMD